MSNPAAELLSIFRTWSDPGAPFNSRGMNDERVSTSTHIRAALLLHEINYAFNEIEANGSSLAAFRAASVKWAHFVWAFPHGWSSTGATAALVSEGRFDMLEALSVVLDASPARVNAQQAVTFGSYLDEIIELLAVDEGIDEALRAYIVKLIAQVRRALDDYKGTGRFDAEEALTHLWVAFMAAEAQSTDHKSSWKKFGLDLRTPVATGVLVGIPTLAMEVLKLTVGA